MVNDVGRPTKFLISLDVLPLVLSVVPGTLRTLGSEDTVAIRFGVSLQFSELLRVVRLPRKLWSISKPKPNLKPAEVLTFTLTPNPFMFFNPSALFHCWRCRVPSPLYRFLWRRVPVVSGVVHCIVS